MARRNANADSHIGVFAPIRVTLSGYNSPVKARQRTSQVGLGDEAHPVVASHWWRRAPRALLRVRLVYLLGDILSSMRVVVDGDSMAPALEAGQYVLASRLACRLAAPARGDIVVAREPVRPDVLCVKRIVGVPGDEVRQERGRLWLNGQLADDTGTGGLPESASASFEWRLGDDEYMVLGDNRRDSRDSRAFGPVKRGHILSRVWFRYWPRERWGRVR